jgi:glycerol-3-phosphate acyltransferase PlsY
MVIICGQGGFFFDKFGAVPQGALIEVYIILGLLTALAYFQHRGNIKKLIQGKERKTYIFKKNKVD